VHVSVSENFKVCNTGNVNVSAITIKDCQGGTWSGQPGAQTCSGTVVTVTSNQSIAAGGSCLTFSSSYSPTAASSGYSDQAIASGTAALSGTVYANNGAAATASCPVCPINTDCSTNPPVAP